MKQTSRVDSTLVDSSGVPTGPALESTQLSVLSILDAISYTEGDIDSSISGVPILGESPSNTLRAFSAVTGGDAFTARGIVAFGKDAQGGTGFWELNVDGDGQLKVVATNLDIRDLTSATDSVEVKQATASNLKAEVVGTGTFAVQHNSTGKTILSAGGSAASSGNNTLVAAGTNRLKVFAFTLSTTSTTAVTCIFQSGAGGTELWRVILQAPTNISTGANLTVTPPAWLFATASATLLNLNLSSAQTVHWSVSYFDEA